MNGSSLMNGSSSNGHGRLKTLPQPPSKKKLDQKLRFMSMPRVLAAFMVVLVVVTLLVDTYFLASTDFRLKRTPLKRFGALSRGNRSKETGKGVQASVKKPWTRRRFKFQDEKHTLPAMEKANGKEPILRVFADAGIPPLNDTVIQQLPTWNEIVQLVGAHPVVGGLDTCDAFKQNVPAVERMLGSSGMFNTGTNLVTHLLKNNCRIPERVEKYGPDASREAYGMRWQVGCVVVKILGRGGVLLVWLLTITNLTFFAFQLSYTGSMG